MIALAGFCVSKKQLLCCLYKYSSKPVANIEYAHDAEGEKDLGSNGDRALDGEIEMRANMKLNKMIGADRNSQGKPAESN